MKILYIMNVDWRWIRQRPHFLAEKLAERNEVFLLYPYSYRSRGLGYCENKASGITPHKYLNLPFRCKVPLIGKLNPGFLRLYFGTVISVFRPDVIWLCRPQDIAFIPESKKHLVCYDCMDDHLSLNEEGDVLRCEQELVGCAKHIFASSNSLIEKLVARFGADRKKITLIRNGYDGKIMQVSGTSRKKEEFHICYVGTISTWFDFELLRHLTERFPEVYFDLIGPTDPAAAEIAVKAAEEKRVCFHGSVEHDKLFDAVREYDCMIMPFRLNEIIESVDPVKLYEYINYHKNIICVRYDEIERFGNFVHFYEYGNMASAEEIIKNLLQDNTCRYSQEQRLAFLQDNTWAKRAEQAEEILKNIKTGKNHE